MTKTEFLQQLYNHLSTLPPAERDDIIADFEEHFQAGAERGKSEEQICAELGNPYNCALQYLRTAGGYAAPGGTVPPTSQSAPRPTPQSVPRPAPQRNINTLWAVLFALGVLCAIGIYPTCAVLVLSPVLIFIAAVFSVAVVPTGTMIGFFISVSVLLFSIGLFGLLVTTWFLKYSFRRADF